MEISNSEEMLFPIIGCVDVDTTIKPIRVTTIKHLINFLGL